MNEGTANTKCAVIYCRTANHSANAAKDDILTRQEARCREFARQNGLKVIEIFRDRISGTTVERPGLQAMLAFLREHEQQGLVVIIEDISRLARSLDAHVQLRTEIASTGAELLSPSFEFGKSPGAVLMESPLASRAQYPHNKKVEQGRSHV